MRWPTATVRKQKLSSYVAAGKYFRIGSGVPYLTSQASAVWPSANRAIYIAFELDRPMWVTQMYALNGATAAGNMDIGLYAADGTRLVSNGSVAQTGTTVLQAFNITDTYLDSGAYWMALALSSASGTMFRLTHGAANDWLIWGGLQQDTAFPLPTTATFAVNTTPYLPLFGLTGLAVI
jgi:hypothetical protein